jgi:glutathione peroxidase
MFSLVLSLIMISTNTSSQTLYDFELKALNSEQIIKFESFKGKKVLLVNVASKCGFTKQYENLQKLHEQYGDKLVVVGLPCNQFMGQEPGTEAEIVTFCSTTYGVSFPMTEKIEVKGENQHALYQWLTSKEKNGVGDFKVSWNFNKFLIDENGNLIEHFDSRIDPLSEEITGKI